MNRNYWLFIGLLYPVLLFAEQQIIHAPLAQADWKAEQSKTLCTLLQGVPGYGRIGFQRRSGEALHVVFQSERPVAVVEKASFYLAPSPWRDELVYQQDYRVYQTAPRAFFVDKAGAEAALESLSAGQSAVFQFVWSNENVYIAALPIGFETRLTDFAACLQQLLPFNKDQLQGIIVFRRATVAPDSHERQRLQHIVRYLKEIKSLKVVISSETAAVAGKRDKKWFEKRANWIKQQLMKAGLPVSRIMIQPISRQPGRNTLQLSVFGPDPLRVYYYRKGSIRLSRREKQRLGKLAEYIKQFHQTGRVIIASHTDSKGRRAANLKVSQRRGEAVKQYLVSQGVPEAQIIVKAYGESRPIKSNRFSSGRAMNRRVVISLRP